MGNIARKKFLAVLTSLLSFAVFRKYFKFYKVAKTPAKAKYRKKKVSVKVSANAYAVKRTKVN
jgi:hypothetical protein